MFVLESRQCHLCMSKQEVSITVVLCSFLPPTSVFPAKFGHSALTAVTLSKNKKNIIQT